MLAETGYKKHVYTVVNSSKPYPHIYARVVVYIVRANVQGQATAGPLQLNVAFVAKILKNHIGTQKGTMANTIVAESVL
jgi:hypothetical protein